MRGFRLIARESPRFANISRQFANADTFPSLQSLDVDLAEREPLLEDLRTAARPLIDTCDARTAQQIDAAVRQAEADWADTRENLQELCTKYQRAADVWRRYRDASDAVKSWADEQMSQLGALQPLDAAKQVEVSVSHCLICSICGDSSARMQSDTVQEYI